MKNCIFCGVTEDKAYLYDVIAKDGVVSTCRKCQIKNDLPLLDARYVGKDPNKSMTVRERLLFMNGLNKDHTAGTSKDSIKATNKDLNSIVEKNFKKNLSSKKDQEALVDNFHWIIMRKRRSLKLTQEQFANKIAEPLIVVQYMEIGELPNEYVDLIRKVERFFNIALFKEESPFFIPARLSSESKFSTGLTLGDLKKMQEGQLENASQEEKKEKKGFFSFLKRKKKKEEPEENKEVAEEASEEKPKEEDSEED